MDGVGLILSRRPDITFASYKIETITFNVKD